MSLKSLNPLNSLRWQGYYNHTSNKHLKLLKKKGKVSSPFIATGIHRGITLQKWPRAAPSAAQIARTQLPASSIQKRKNCQMGSKGRFRCLPLQGLVEFRLTRGRPPCRQRRVMLSSPRRSCRATSKTLTKRHRFNEKVIMKKVHEIFIIIWILNIVS